MTHFPSKKTPILSDFETKLERMRTEAGCPPIMRRALLSLLLLSGCSKGPEVDVQYIGQARSLGAEWALVNELASQGKLTATYTNTMRTKIREQLKTSARSVTSPSASYAAEMRTLIALPDDARPDDLRAHVEQLKKFEDSIESA